MELLNKLKTDNFLLQNLFINMSTKILLTKTYSLIENYLFND